MKLVRIDPPGTFCSNEALRDLVKQTGAKTFVDVGCGNGTISKLLCSMGMSGTGVDFSKLSLETSAVTLKDEIAAGRYKLVEGDATKLETPLEPADLVLSYMVMEHVHDDVGFVQTLSSLTKKGGYLALCVPGRRDRWSFEDETVGHLRRYDRGDLDGVLSKGGLKNVQVWSVGVPIGNITFSASKWLVEHSKEKEKLGQSQREQTESSGVRDIPWKTVFPAPFKLLLNRVTLFPLFVIQRFFYRSKMGITMLGFGKVGSS